MNKRPFIEHFVMEIFDIKRINKAEDLYDKIKYFIKKCELNVISKTKHNFSPGGFTLAFTLSESHIIFHSWPEKDYLNIDFMSCKSIKSKNEIISFAKEIFGSSKVKLRRIKYGNK